MRYASVLALSFFFLFLLVTPRSANACCVLCAQTDCDQATDFISQAHEDIRERVKDEFDDDLDRFEEWMIDYMMPNHFVKGTGDMLNQMGAVAMQYTQMIGGFIDAQTQLDTQRLIRRLQFEAHRDYQPSEGFCTFGTNVKSLGGAQTVSRFNSLALSRFSLTRQLGTLDSSASMSREADYKARWDQFVDTYCDYGDNNMATEFLSTLPTPLPDPIEGTGLQFACDRDGPSDGVSVGMGEDYGAIDKARVNRDLDYTRLIEEPRTLNVEFIDDTLDVEVEPYESLIGVGASIPLPGFLGGGSLPAIVQEPGDEEDVIAMSKNLYGHKVLSRELSNTLMKTETAQRLYLALRSVVAKRSVAQSSFNAIVGLKSSGTSHEENGLLAPIGAPTMIAAGVNPLAVGGALTMKQSRRFMASIVNQLLPASTLIGGNIFDLIGWSPSYYSQLEILAKRIYQDPNFYVDLYDKPANVTRKKVAMKAIELMLDRAIYESQLRREMNISVLLSSRLQASHRRANRKVTESQSEAPE